MCVHAIKHDSMNTKPSKMLNTQSDLHFFLGKMKTTLLNPKLTPFG